MPEFTALTVVLLALFLVMGVLLGWILRGDRCAKEKITVNASWQQQIESQQSEHDRLAKQNKSLMEQISQYQASIKDSTLRAKELSDSLKDSFQRRDELQRQLKDVRGNLEVATAQRDRLQAELRNSSAKVAGNEQVLQQKDDKIQRLSSELANWQSRVPPLVDRFRARDEEARDLERELEEIRVDNDQARAERDEAQTQLKVARDRIAALEGVIGSEHTRIEPVDAGTLPEGLDASNEPHGDTIESEITGLRDQIDDNALPLSNWQPEDGSADPIPIAAADDDGPWARVPTSAGQVPASFEDSVAADDDDLIGVAGDAVDTLDSLETSADAPLPPYLSGSLDGFAGYPQTNAGTIGNADDSSDDLKEIKGVGPAIEKTLHDLGFFHFRQIAEMSEFDIDRVARQLKGFRSRIYREDWIGQARMLQQQKNNGPD
jgi:uncharacterized phage infection (PIP) family protein YhgE